MKQNYLELAGEIFVLAIFLAFLVWSFIQATKDTGPSELNSRTRYDMTDKIKTRKK